MPVLAVVIYRWILCSSYQVSSLSAYLLGKDVGFCHLLLDLDRLDFGLLNKHIHILLSLRQFCQSRIKAINGLLHTLPLLGKHILVELDELQERLGRCVVVPLLSLQDGGGGLAIFEYLVSVKWMLHWTHNTGCRVDTEGITYPCFLFAQHFSIPQGSA